MRTLVFLIVGVVSVIDLILASVLFIPATEITGDDGNVTYVCKLPYEGGVFPITNKTVYLPLSDYDCMKCDKCTPTGSGCIQMFRACPAEQDLKDDEVLLHLSKSTVTESTEENTDGTEESTEGTEVSTESTEDTEGTEESTESTEGTETKENTSGSTEKPKGSTEFTKHETTMKNSQSTVNV